MKLAEIDELDASEYADWQELDRLYPWLLRPEWYFGLLAMKLHNAWFTEPRSAADFFPSLRTHLPPEDRNDMLRVKMEAFTAYHNREEDDGA